MKILPLSGVLVELHPSLIRTCVPFYDPRLLGIVIHNQWISQRVGANP